MEVVDRLKEMKIKIDEKAIINNKLNLIDN